MARAKKTAKKTAKRRPGPKKGEGGRPKIEFNLRQVEGLGAIMATNEEVAAVLDCSISTIEDRLRTDENFSRALQKGRATGKLSLRREQWATARGRPRTERTLDDGTREVRPAQLPNPTMQIWLGKNWLDQSDQLSVDATIEGKTGVAHVPPEVSLEYWEEKYGAIEHEVSDAEPDVEPN